MKKINDSLNKAQSGNVPMIVSYFLSTLMSSAAITLAGYLEIWILGSGSDATENLAAYAGVATLQAWITAIAYFFAMGTGCAVAGAKDGEEVKAGLVGLILGGIVGGILVFSSLVIRPEWMFVFGTKKESIQQTYEGVRLMLLAAPGLILSHIFGTFFRSLGKKLISAVGLSVMGIAQIVTAYLLVFAGLKKLTAVVWGIAIGQGLSLILFLFTWIIFLTKEKKQNLRMKKIINGPKDSAKKIIQEIIKSGLPSLARQGSISAGMWATNLIAGGYGMGAQSLMTAANRFMTLPFGIIIAICQAYQPIASRSEGNGENGKKEEYIIARRFGLWMITIAVIGVIIAGKGILSAIPGEIQGKDTLLVIIGSQTMVLPAVMCSQLIITQFQVCKDWKAGVFLAILRNGLVFVPVLWILNRCFGIWGLFLGQSITDLLVLPASIKLLQKRGAFGK